MALLRCVEAFAFTDHKSGQNRVVRTGDLLNSNDPRVKGREQWFETVDETAERVTSRPVQVEQATAAPGERRTARRRASKE